MSQERTFGTTAAASNAKEASPSSDPLDTEVTRREFIHWSSILTLLLSTHSLSFLLNTWQDNRAEKYSDFLQEMLVNSNRSVQALPDNSVLVKKSESLVAEQGYELKQLEVHEGDRFMFSQWEALVVSADENEMILWLFSENDKQQRVELSIAHDEAVTILPSLSKVGVNGMFKNFDVEKLKARFPFYTINIKDELAE